IACDLETTVLELLDKVQQQSNNSMNFEYVGLAEIQNQTTLKGDLIKTLFTFENYHVAKSEVSSQDIGSRLESAREQTNFDISFTAYTSKNNIYMKTRYKSELYSKKYTETLLNQLLNIL